MEMNTERTGTKPGCGEGECGACTVLVDGAPVLAWQTAAAEVAGRSVTTVKGLAGRQRLHPVQQALAEEPAFQCGYCTPAMALGGALFEQVKEIPSAGAGETPLIAVAPAIGNAIFPAAGRRLRALPMLQGPAGG